ncbi:hypothetical protein [Lysobacter gummosus]|uniref:hypothetical protein n=1 Tax=Lysobacter gummosus TaxID=262324 RepID=UPI003637D949
MGPVRDERTNASALICAIRSGLRRSSSFSPLDHVNRLPVGRYSFSYSAASSNRSG